MTRRGEIDIKKRMRGLTTGFGLGAGDRGEPLGAVAVDDSSNRRPARQFSGSVPCMYLGSSGSYPLSGFTFSLPTEAPVMLRSIPYGAYTILYSRNE